MAVVPPSPWPSENLACGRQNNGPPRMCTSQTLATGMQQLLSWKRQGNIRSQSLQKEHSPANIFILAETFWIRDLWNC